jgi:hypothetical protein
VQRERSRQVLPPKMEKMEKMAQMEKMEPKGKQ